jgi:hypothetical protein
MKRFNLISLFVVVALLGSMAFASGPQITAPALTATANLTVPESLTTSISGGPFTIPLGGGASNTVSVLVAYNVEVSTLSTGIESVAYWSSSSAALSAGGSTNVPASALSLQFASGSWGSCGGSTVQGIGLAGATCPVNTSTSMTGLAANGGIASGYTDTYALKYTGGTLPASATPYTGVLTITYFGI